jgi:hypothetical protein
MKIKPVSFWIDLMPGWQDQVDAHGINHSLPYAYNSPPTYPPSPSAKRIRVIVDLPCFGGSAEPEIILRPIVTEEEK